MAGTAEKSPSLFTLARNWNQLLVVLRGHQHADRFQSRPEPRIYRICVRNDVAVHQRNPSLAKKFRSTQSLPDLLIVKAEWGTIPNSIGAFDDGDDDDGIVNFSNVDAWVLEEESGLAPPRRGPPATVGRVADLAVDREVSEGLVASRSDGHTERRPFREPR